MNDIAVLDTTSPTEITVTPNQKTIAVSVLSLAAGVGAVVVYRKVLAKITARKNAETVTPVQNVTTAV